MRVEHLVGDLCPAPPPGHVGHDGVGRPRHEQEDERLLDVSFLALQWCSICLLDVSCDSMVVELLLVSQSCEGDPSRFLDLKLLVAGV